LEEEREYLISQLIDEWRNISLSIEFRNHIVDVLNSPNLPINQLRILAESDISFFAPGPNILGQVRELKPSIGRIVYFSPRLLEMPSDIKAIIAHELAHVVLEHGEEPSSTEEVSAAARDDEKEADKLAESWGFRVPESYRNRL
jgi:Zn-dependent protease with chaperone function